MVATTPRNAIAAAMFLGDYESSRYCPTGLSNSDNLAALIGAAADAGCVFDRQ
jgi:hypothetical protein